MNWLAKNASAIQAIASVVGALITTTLAAITYWYVKVTSEIAKSSAEQVKQMRDKADAEKQHSQDQRLHMARRLKLVAERSRLTIEKVPFTPEGLLGFAMPTQGDISSIELMSWELRDPKVLDAANKVVITLRSALQVIAAIKGITDDSRRYAEAEKHWKGLVEIASKSVHQLENQCDEILG